MSLSSLCDKTVTIQRISTSTDNWGGVTESYAGAGSAKARVRPVSGNDAIVASKPDLRISHIFYFATNPTVQSGDRFLYDSRYFYVKNIRDIDEQNRLLTVDCEERDA
jgi:SPP1 family predicted phage head-tail adaptor